MGKNNLVFGFLFDVFYNSRSFVSEVDSQHFRLRTALNKIVSEYNTVCRRCVPVILRQRMVVVKQISISFILRIFKLVC